MRGAVTYSRVSTIEQVRNLSLPMQVRATREWCHRKGYEIVREFVEEGESAKTMDRPQLLALLDYCRKNRDKLQGVASTSV